MNTMTLPRTAQNSEDTKALLGDVLNRLGAKLMDRMLDVSGRVPDSFVANAETQRLRDAIGELGCIASGMGVIDSANMPDSGAGYGSEVEVRNLDSGHVQTYTLLIGSLMDLESNHVSLASPVGQALLGRRPGDEVVIAAPQRQVRLRVVAVHTLAARLASITAEFLDD